MSEKYKLTPVEHELMEILWKIRKGTVHDVMENLSKTRKLAYTSVSTMLRIMQQKKILSAEKNGRQHIYQPLLQKEKFASHSVNKMVEQVFSGSPVEMVAYLMSKNNLTADELAEMQKLINHKKKELKA